MKTNLSLPDGITHAPQSSKNINNVDLSHNMVIFLSSTFMSLTSDTLGVQVSMTMITMMFITAPYTNKAGRPTILMMYPLAKEKLALQTPKTMTTRPMTSAP